MRERRAQLARIIAFEGGYWQRVIELTENVTVVAVSTLTIRFLLDCLVELPLNPAVKEGAFCDRDNGKLYVRVASGRPDWQALARVVRDEILPGFGPGISLAIKAALAAQSQEDADAELADYPPLENEVLAEFERAAQEQAQGADCPDGADFDSDGYDEPDGEDGYGEPDGEDGYGEPDGEDGTADDQGDVSDRHDGANPGDDQHNDESGQARRGTSSRTGDNGKAQPGGSGTDGAANGRSSHHGTGAGSGEKKRSTSGKKQGARPDSQLISYVSPNPSGPEPGRSEDRSREQHLRDAAGEAGVDLVIKHLEAELRETGSRVEKMPKNNKGYDILVRDANGEPQRYIEVKATEEAWGLRGVGLTEPQFSLARQERERYWLYVVEHIYQPEARLWWIHDPAGRVDYFHYDYGWRTATQGQARVTGASAHGVPQSV